MHANCRTKALEVLGSMLLVGVISIIGLASTQQFPRKRAKKEINDEEIDKLIRDAAKELSTRTEDPEILSYINRIATK